MKMKAYFAYKYVVGVKTPLGRYKVFQIVLSKKDGSIYVAFPYFSCNGGTFGEVSLDSSIQYPTDIIVGDDFAVSSYCPKYSHHASGQAHFSLQGKIKTEIKKQSVPLSSARGHLFTVMMQGIENFDVINPQKDKGSKKRGVFEFPFDRESPMALKFVCYFYGKSELSQIIVRADNPSPWITCITPEGKKFYGILLATTFQNPNTEKYLLLTVESIDKINKQESLFISFLGGFDPPEQVLDCSQDTSFLMFLYPNNADISSLKKTLKCLDL